MSSVSRPAVFVKASSWSWATARGLRCRSGGTGEALRCCSRLSPVSMCCGVREGHVEAKQPPGIRLRSGEQPTSTSPECKRPIHRYGKTDAVLSIARVTPERTKGADAGERNGTKCTCWMATGRSLPGFARRESRQFDQLSAGFAISRSRHRVTRSQSIVPSPRCRRSQFSGIRG